MRDKTSKKQKFKDPFPKSTGATKETPSLAHRD